MSVEVMNETDSLVHEEDLVRVARHVLESLGVSPLAELAITLVDVDHMTELHVKWMGEPGPTDVLSFPMDELDLRGSRGAGHAHEEKPDDTAPMMLGDVVLCPEVAQKQAKEAGHSFEDELHLLTTHGILHLVGFDHAEPDEYAEMFGLQGELLESWKASRST
ncbi:MAG: putative rRNA maturation factor [Frankiales bacterium]|jgi:probable rRNA maturation factor|nr:putative rRNA maturation factor [Frankiales bacterium]